MPTDPPEGLGDGSRHHQAESTQGRARGAADHEVRVNKGSTLLLEKSVFTKRSWKSSAALAANGALLEGAGRKHRRRCRGSRGDETGLLPRLPGIAKRYEIRDMSGAQYERL
jgi:hypothetical protein